MAFQIVGAERQARRLARQNRVIDDDDLQRELPPEPRLIRKQAFDTMVERVILFLWPGGFVSAIYDGEAF